MRRPSTPDSMAAEMVTSSSKREAKARQAKSPDMILTEEEGYMVVSGFFSNRVRLFSRLMSRTLPTSLSGGGGSASA